VLIDVVHTLRTKFPDIVLLIAGDGPEEEHLKKQVQTLKAQAYIIFTGRLSKAELGKYWFRLMCLSLTPRTKDYHINCLK